MVKQFNSHTVHERGENSLTLNVISDINLQYKSGIVPALKIVAH